MSKYLTILVSENYMADLFMYLIFFGTTLSYAFFAAESALILFDSLRDLFYW